MSTRKKKTPSPVPEVYRLTVMLGAVDREFEAPTKEELALQIRNATQMALVNGAQPPRQNEDKKNIEQTIMLMGQLAAQGKAKAAAHRRRVWIAQSFSNLQRAFSGFFRPLTQLRDYKQKVWPLVVGTIKHPQLAFVYYFRRPYPVQWLAAGGMNDPKHHSESTRVRIWRREIIKLGMDPNTEFIRFFRRIR